MAKELKGHWLIYERSRGKETAEKERTGPWKWAGGGGAVEGREQKVSVMEKRL